MNHWITFYVISCVGILLYYNKKLENVDERKFILIFVCIGLISRLSCGIILHYFVINYRNSYDIFGDGAAYVRNAKIISEIFNNIGSTNFADLKFPGLTDYQTTLWAYLLGVTYTLLGYNSFAGIMINSLLGVLTAINLYFLLIFLTNNKITVNLKKISLLLFLFFPSLFLWSVTNLRDTFIIFLFSVFLLFASKHEKTTFFYTFFLLAISLLIYALRYKLLYPMIILITITTIVRLLNVKYPKRILFTTCLLSLLLIVVVPYVIINHEFIINQINSKSYFSQLGHLTSGGINYYILPKDYYFDKEPLGLSAFIIIFFKGWLHLLLEPVFYNMKSFPLIFSFPQMILWYFLLFFSGYGMIISLRTQIPATLIIISFIFIMGTMLAMSGGNIGTIFRLRDMISPYFIVFSILGINNMIYEEHSTMCCTT